jgi:hypothetical protein
MKAGRSKQKPGQKCKGQSRPYRIAHRLRRVHQRHVFTLRLILRAINALLPLLQLVALKLELGLLPPLYLTSLSLVYRNLAIGGLPVLMQTKLEKRPNRVSASPCM